MTSTLPPFHTASALSVFIFDAILAGVVVALLFGVYLSNIKTGENATKRTLATLAGAVAWLSLLSSLVWSGMLANAPAPVLLLFFAASNLMGIFLAFSPLGSRLSANLPLGFLVGFQAFRLPLELVLHDWAKQGTIPNTMSWNGANFDIISGVVALIVAPFASRSHAATWMTNIVGAGLLLNVMRVAIFSSPLPFAWTLSEPLQLVFHLPYALIAPVCVAGALCGHIILTRALLKLDHKIGF